MAGVLPFCLRYNAALQKPEVFFLFHKTFVGKKVGTLIDFGGALNNEENVCKCAARELCEETGGLLFSSNLEEDVNHFLETKKEMELQQSVFVRETSEKLGDWLAYVVEQKTSGTSSDKDKLQGYQNLWHKTKVPENIWWISSPYYTLYFFEIDDVDLTLINNAYQQQGNKNFFLNFLLFYC
jgi:hypothetical protein